MSKTAYKNTQQVGYGKEPVWDFDIDSPNFSEELTIKFPQFFNWYSMTKGAKEAKKYLLDYFITKGINDSELITFVQSYPDKAFHRTVPWLARIVSKAKTPVPDWFVEKIDTHIENLKEEKRQADLEKQNQTKQVATTKPLIRFGYICEMLEVLSKYVLAFGDGKNKDIYFNSVQYLQSFEFTGEETEIVLTSIQRQLSEYKFSLEDPEIDEAYSFMSVPKRKRVVEFLIGEIKSVENLLKNSSNRKTVSKRKRKVVPAKVVRKLKFKRECEELKIKSESPVSLVGAKTAVLYNTKTKQMQIYVADPNGLTVKGTTMVNFDTKHSSGRVVRKPEEFLSNIKELSKTQILSEFNKLTTKEKPLTGRVNMDTLILKVF